MKKKCKKMRTYSSPKKKQSSQNLISNPEDERIQIAKRELEKFSSQEQFHENLFPNEIRIDDWTETFPENEQAKYKTIGQAEQHQKSNQYYYEYSSLSKSGARQRKKIVINPSTKRPQLSFRSMKPVDGNEAMKKTLRRSNEQKIQAVKRIMSKTPLQTHRSFRKREKDSERNDNKTHLETFRLEPHERNFIFGKKFNFISLDPDILNNNMKKEGSLKEYQRKKMKPKHLKNKNLGFISEQLRKEFSKQKGNQLPHNHSYNESQLFLKMGMLKPEVSRLLDLIHKEENAKIRFNIQQYRKKKIF